MKLLKAIILVVTAILISGTTTPATTQNPEQLYQKALIKEEGEGALQEAINLYRRTVENPEANKSLQAKALLHIGMCYEKMGKQEALKTYQQLINNYPDQENEVSMARERLADLKPSTGKEANSPKAMVIKKLWEGMDVDDTGEVSPNGKYLSYNDWDTGNLAIYVIATGEKQMLTDLNPGQEKNYDQFAFSPRWSHDSKKLYYSIFVSRELSELRSIGLNDNTSKTIAKIEGKDKWLKVYDVSNDGNTILATIETISSKTEIVLISIKDGSIEVVNDFLLDQKTEEIKGPWAYTGFVENLEFTNSGDAIIYNYPPDLNSPNHDIYLLSMKDKSETPLIKNPANDFILGMTPDGKNLLFASDRSGQLGFWSIAIENEKAVGSPALIKTSEHPYVKGMGFTDKNEFVYCHFPSKTDVFELQINPQTGDIEIPPTEKIGTFIGSNGTPDYSSDGDYMAYVSRRLPFSDRQTFRPSGNTLCIKSLKDGSVNEIKLDISNFGFPKWAPDNRSILVVNWASDHTMGLYDVDIETGKSVTIYQGESQSLNGHEWGPDRKSIIMMRNKGDGNYMLVNHNIETGKERLLTEGSWMDIISFSRSADGQWISFMGLNSNRSLKIIPSSGGEIKEIHQWDQGNNVFIFHCWSADGKYLYVPKYREPKEDLLWDIWQIPVNGSAPKALGLQLTDIWQLSAHPDGKRIAFSNKGFKYKLPEIWMIENFLPKEETIDLFK